MDRLTKLERKLEKLNNNSYKARDLTIWSNKINKIQNEIEDIKYRDYLNRKSAVNQLLERCNEWRVVFNSLAQENMELKDTIEHLKLK